MNAHHQKIRELLAGSDGLTVKQLQWALQIDVRTLNKSIKSMGDAYIDRWTGPYRGQWAAVWCVVEVPQHCPKPDEKNMAAPQAQTQRDSGARSDDLGDGQSQRTADDLRVEQQRQSLGGQALSYIRKSLWRKRRATNPQLDEVDQKQ